MKRGENVRTVGFLGDKRHTKGTTDADFFSFLLTVFCICFSIPSVGHSHLGRDLKNTFMSGFNKLMDASQTRPKVTDIFKRKERTDSMKST